ncbi:MAG: PDZ domain-containing protein [Chloroflexota bacterium]
MSFKSRAAILVFMSVLLLRVAAPIAAQDAPAPDPLNLAARLLGFSGDPAIPMPSPIYKVGDKLQFWVNKAGQEMPVQITAELAGDSATAYVWVEDGTSYDPAKMGTLASQLDVIYNIFRIQSNYGRVSTIPQAPSDLDNLSVFAMPDVDNDPHIYILYASNLAGNRVTIFDPANSLEADYVPGGFTNEHEMVLVNMSSFPNTVPLDDPAYVNIITRQFYAAVAYYNNPAQTAWLGQATSFNMLLQIQQLQNPKQGITPDNFKPFLNAPETPLTRLPGLGSVGQEIGAGQLFMRYVLQRFGFNVYQAMLVGSGNGLSALDDALHAYHIVDLVTGDPIRARDVFADFVLANVLNHDFGDGRYAYIEPAMKDLVVLIPTATDRFNFDLPDQPLPQLGTNYVGLAATKATTFTVFFSGQENVARLPMPAGDVGNHFYWSGSSTNRDTALTRAFDLTDVKTAQLTFDAWYNLIDGWNYAYIEVSADEGKTWKILPASSTRTFNAYALGYGPGFTGISTSEKARPFPYLGISLDIDGLTITQIVPTGPLANTKIKVGDTIAGYDGKPWSGQQNLLAFLANYDAGDTVNFYIQRGKTFFDAPVVLAAHPTRRKIPDAVWMPQTVDLSAYAGKQIAVRFESISLPGNEDNGVALDNIRIPEIGFQDDAENGVPGWTLDGWQQTTNEVRQQFILQAAVVSQDASQTKVLHLLSPMDTATSGQWDFTLQPNQKLVLAISGANENTTTLGSYNLSARAAG